MESEILGYIFAGLVGLVLGVVIAVIALEYMGASDWDEED